MDRHKTLADALEEEVLSDMAGTFFGTRAAVDGLVEGFRLHVTDLRGRAAGRVFPRVLFLRGLVLGAAGETALFSALGLPPPFPDVKDDAGRRPWRPDHLPFAFLASSRYAKLVLLAYAEVRHACDVYMNGELEPDPAVSGRKRLSLNYRLLEAQAVSLNERIDKLNSDMPPSSMLRYAREITSVEEPGQGAITNTLGADSLDRGLLFQRVDFAGLKLWKAPELPKPELCAKPLQAFCAKFFRGHAEPLKVLLAELKA